MSESKITPETPVNPPPQDGSESVAEGEHHPKGLTRRQFLKGAAATAGYFLGRKLFPTGATVEEDAEPTPEPEPASESREKEKPLFTPESIHGVAVYGLKEKIETQEQIDELYNHFDSLFDARLPEHMRQQENFEQRFEQRDYLLDPDKRYLEMVVGQSAYQSFLDRKEETGVDFVEWIKMHVDAMNRCLENAKPRPSIRAELLRIVVVDDGFEDNPSKYSKDLDGTWFIGSDYRVNQREETDQVRFWSFYRDEGGNLIFRSPPSGDEIGSEYTYPPKDDSLTERDSVWLDFNLVHECSHAILNIPDEYAYSHDYLGAESGCRFNKFFFLTGSFQEPWFSPNLAYVLMYYRERRIRGYYTDQGGLGRDSSYRRNAEKPWVYSQRPAEVRLTIREGSTATEGVSSIFTARQEGDDSSKKTFLDTPDQESSEYSFILDDKVFREHSLGEFVYYPINWVLRVENGIRRELHLPAAMFYMSKIAGKDRANYTISFTGYDDPSKKTQILKLVDGSDLDQLLKDCRSKGDYPYAQMRVDGTPIYFIWLLRE